MKIDDVLHMIQKLHQENRTPRTIVMSTKDFEDLNLPKWTKQLFGLKLVVAFNMPHTFVTDHIYESVTTKKVDPYDLREWQKEKAHGSAN